MRKTLTFLLPAVLGLLAPMAAMAFTIPNTWYSEICGPGRPLPCTGVGMGLGAEGLVAYLMAKGVVTMQIGFVAVAVFMLFMAARAMVMFPEQEESVKQGRSTFIYTIVGASVVSIAQWIANAFAPGPGGTDNDIVNVEPINDIFHNVLDFFRTILSILLVVNIVVQGIRLVTSQGENDQVEKARKRLIQGFVGVGLVMLANTIAVSMNPQQGSSGQLAVEIAGVANYLVTILGFLCVATIIMAGVLLVLSVSDSLKEKAKTMVKTSVIALVAVVVSYALVNTVIAFPTS